VPAVSDSGPLIHLAQTNQVKLLKPIFGSVLIVPAVEREVVDEGFRGSYPDAKLVAEALEEGYIIVRRIDSRISNRASRLARQEKISEADSQTLLLAKTLRKPLLTDEKILSTLAKMYGLDAWNTWTVLLEALRTKLIEKHEIHQAISELGDRRHKLSSSYAKQVLGAADRITASRTSNRSKTLRG
jgi:predicted nucleic acid-binding protein